LFYADRQTDIRKLIIALHNFEKASKNASRAIALHRRLTEMCDGWQNV